MSPQVLEDIEAFHVSLVRDLPLEAEMTEEALVEAAEQLLLAGRRLELRRSRELAGSIHEREMQSVQQALKESILDANRIFMDYYELSFKDPSTIVITDRTQQELITMTVSNQTVGSQRFRYFVPDGRKQVELTGEDYSLDVLPHGEFGWRRDKGEPKSIRSSRGVATEALDRLLYYAARRIMEEVRRQ